MRARIAFLAASALIFAGCAMDTSESESVGSTQQPLLHGETDYFTQQIRHAWPWDKQTHICELSVLVQALSPIEFDFVEAVDGVSVPFYSVTWNGHSLPPDPTPGKPKDRVEVRGDCAGVPCRVTARMTTKGNAPGVSLGCEISAAHSGMTEGFAPPVPFLIGHTDGAALSAHVLGAPKEVILFREKVGHGEQDLGMRHDCTVRHVASSVGPGPVHQFESTGHVVYQNGSPLASPTAPVPLGTVSWPTNVLDLPTPIVPPFDFPGRYMVGQDPTSERIKSFIPFNGTLAPSDVMSCEDTLRLVGADEPVVVVQRPAAEVILGMWLRPGAQPQP